MTRTIEVVFIDPLTHKVCTPKRYKFLCNNDEISLNYIVRDLRYTGWMKVVGITNCTLREQNGIQLKDIEISCYEKPNKKTDNNSARNFSLQKDIAKKWYNSGVKELEEAALLVFAKEELEELTYYEIVHKGPYCNFKTVLPLKVLSYVDTFIKLKAIANFLNEGWEKTNEDPGYVITPNNANFLFEGKVTKEYLTPRRAEYVETAGTIYFKDRSTTYKAIEMLGEEIAKELF